MMNQLSDQVKSIMVERRSLLKLTPSKGRTSRVPVVKRTSSQKIARRTGRLKQFLDLPLDIIFAIASAFKPRDLLSLARVNKAFRFQFMSRRARLVWRASLENVPGLPPCPPDLTEPQYASLLFENYCFACDKVRGGRPYYALRIRLCAPCARLNIVRGFSFPHIQATLRVDSLLPRAVLADDDRCHRELRTTITSLENTIWHNYLESEATTVRSRLQAVMHDPVTQKQLVKDYQAMATALMQHGAAMMIWEEAAEEEKQREADILRRTRRKQIKKRMKSLGWNPEYYPSCDDNGKDLQRWHNFMTQPRELTGTAWSVMLPKLDAIYQRSKARRLKAEKARESSALHFIMEDVRG